jgi:hypothetical protein
MMKSATLNTSRQRRPLVTTASAKGHRVGAGVAWIEVSQVRDDARGLKKLTTTVTTVATVATTATAATTAPATVATTATATTAVANHLLESRVDVLLGLAKDVNEITSLLSVWETVSFCCCHCTSR